MKIHCIIISWESFYEKSKEISEKMESKVDSLTVIYSNKKNVTETGAGNWIQVPNDWFYGKKFKRSLDEIKSDEVLLLIHADAKAESWEEIVTKCRSVMINQSIGIWAPNVIETSWTDNRVVIANNNFENISFVTQTDGIVFSYNEKILERLKKINYENNNLGWGIDWIAICHAYVNNMLVIRDDSIMIEHKQGSGYSHHDASIQMNEFLLQMDTSEYIMYQLLNSFSLDTTTALRVYKK